MCLAIHIYGACHGIMTEPDGAVLMRDSGKRYPLAQVEVMCEKPFVTLGSMMLAIDGIESLFELMDET
jgi:hypothetical protein